MGEVGFCLARDEEERIITPGKSNGQHFRRPRGPKHTETIVRGSCDCSSSHVQGQAGQGINQSHAVEGRSIWMSFDCLPMFVFTETWSIRQPIRREGLVRGPSVTGASSKGILVLQLPHPMLHLRRDGFVPATASESMEMP